MIEDNGISYSNKDILFKFVSQTYRNKSLKVYGLELPLIKEMIPANFPAVTANELKSDNIFLLEDDSILVLEYESEVKTSDFLKYASYIIRLAQRYLVDKKSLPKIRVAVI